MQIARPAAPPNDGASLVAPLCRGYDKRTFVAFSLKGQLVSIINVNPWSLLRPRRKPVGISAILLPFEEKGGVDWPGFRGHVARTAAAGLTPAVNMDTGFGNL